MDEEIPIRGVTQGPADIEPDVLSVDAVPYRDSIRLSIDHWRAGGDEVEISARSAAGLVEFLRNSRGFLQGRPAGTRSWRADGSSRLTRTPLALATDLANEYSRDGGRTIRLRIMPRTPTYATPLASIELDGAGVEALVERLIEAQRQLSAPAPALG